MPRGQHGRHHLALGSVQRVSPVRSLPARISFIVFGATLFTSLVVTGISVRSIDRFLRGKIEQTFPATLESTSQRLELWYDQRLLELGVFASSRILAENLPSIDPSSQSDRAIRASREVEQYLEYVLGSFPQYDALFVLSPEGERLLWVGTEYQLPEQLTQGSLAGVTSPRLSPAIGVPDNPFQLASAELGDSRGRRSGTLHAVMPLRAIGEALLFGDLSDVGEIFLVDRAGRYLIASPERFERGDWKAPTSETWGDSAVVDYFDDSGQRVVASTLTLSRYGWVIGVEKPYRDAFAPVVSGIRRILGINLAIVLLFALGAFRIAGSIARPIEALSNAARRISEGEKGVEIPETDSRDEVGVLTRTFNEMTSRLESNTRDLEASQAETQKAVDLMREQNEELQRVNEILEQLSITDGLTKLHNHRYFQEHLAKEVKRAARALEPLALILIDIDHFKIWNDRLGHSGGDDILRRIAEIMQQLTRETDLLARYGGEEFALLLPNTELDGAIQLAEKIRSTVAETRFFLDPPSERQALTVSVGVSIFHGEKRAFFDEADQALYRAKAAGRDCVMVFEIDEPPSDTQD
jgi:diguanylate cyclase (GGDEF)-like protein